MAKSGEKANRSSERMETNELGSAAGALHVQGEVRDRC